MSGARTQARALRTGASAVLFGLLAILGPASRDAFAQRDQGTAPVNGEDITLAVGETKIISAKDVKNYSEGVAGIIDIKLTSDASQFVLNGKKPGSTTLLLIKNDGSQITLNIDVFLRSPQAVERELAQLLDGLRDVRVRRVGSRIVIDGTVANDNDLKRVAHVASLYPGQVESLVALPGQVGVPSGAGQQKYIVRIDFYFVQYDRNSSYGVGLGWPASIGGDAVLKNEFTYDFLNGSARSATATITAQPLPRLDIASRKGWAKVLKQATVITNNGQEATFSNGGEQNFTVNTGLTIGIQRITFGTDVTVLPRFNPERRELDIKLTSDVADLTASISGTPLPGRTTTKLSTNVTLKLGQSLVLSGIRSQSKTHNVAGLPILSEIPVLGVLFGTHSDSDLETEGAIFLVPSVVEAIPSSSRDLVETALAKFRNYSGNVTRVNAYDSRPAGGVGVPPAPRD
jgi:pilus assembly protein CpaC